MSVQQQVKAQTLTYLYEQIFGDLLKDPAITELAVNRPGEIFYERNGRWECIETPSLTYQRLEAFAINAAIFNSQAFEERSNPVLSAVLPNGERLQAVAPPACQDGRISITIRRPSFDVRHLSGYVDSGFFNEVRIPGEKSSDALELAELAKSFDDPAWIKAHPQEEVAAARAGFVLRAVQLGKNIVVAGETGSGKTTFMKALMQEIPTTERIITIEDVPELLYGLPNHKNQVNLLYPSEGTGDLNAATLMKSCLRMKPDRILIAELRGGENYDWLNACLSGHGGSITSCHAGSCKGVFDYLALKVLQSEAGSKLPNNVIKELLNLVIDVVIHIHNDHGHRFITEILYNER